MVGIGPFHADPRPIPTPSISIILSRAIGRRLPIRWTSRRRRLTGDARMRRRDHRRGLYRACRRRSRLTRDYGMDVRVLEAAEPGWGASGRNGGFSCIGCHKRCYAHDDQALWPRGDARILRRHEGCGWSRARSLPAHGIDAWIHEGGEISLAHLPNRMAELEEERDFMARRLRREDGTWSAMS